MPEMRKRCCHRCCHGISPERGNTRCRCSRLAAQRDCESLPESAGIRCEASGRKVERVHSDLRALGLSVGRRAVSCCRSARECARREFAPDARARGQLDIAPSHRGSCLMSRGAPRKQIGQEDLEPGTVPRSGVDDFEAWTPELSTVFSPFNVLDGARHASTGRWRRCARSPSLLGGARLPAAQPHGGRTA